MYFALDWMTWILIAILSVIMIARLYAMYQRSRKVLVLVVVVFIAINVTNTVILAINMKYISAEQTILSGTYQCVVDNPKHLATIPWILATMWEVYTLCLAIRIALKHFFRIATTISGRYHSGLLHSVTKNSHELLCELCCNFLLQPWLFLANDVT